MADHPNKKGIQYHSSSGSMKNVEYTKIQSSEDFTVTVNFEEFIKSKEAYQKNLFEQIEVVSGRSKLLRDIEEHQCTAENVIEIYKTSTQLEKNISFLWSVYLNRLDLLEGLLAAGAEICYSDRNGYTAVFSAAFNICLQDLNDMKKVKLVKANKGTPYNSLGNCSEAIRLLIKNGADVSSAIKLANQKEPLLHCAVRSNSIDCVRLCLLEGANSNAFNPIGLPLNAIHLASYIGHAQCLSILLESDRANVNIKDSVGSTALHLAAKEGHLECINLLLAKGADVTATNRIGKTAVHLAAGKSLECVRSILRYEKASANTEANQKTSPLFAAVVCPNDGYELVELLLDQGLDINHQDDRNYTPIHLAALHSLTPIVELLLDKHADITTISRNGTTALSALIRNTPNSLTQKFDAAITFKEDTDAANRKVKLDFQLMFNHRHPHEISFLKHFVDEGDEGKAFLKHPLCSSFLYIKWQKIRKYYIAQLVFCFIKVLLLTLYVLTALAQNCYNESKNITETIAEQDMCKNHSILGDQLLRHPIAIEICWWLLSFFMGLELCRKIYGLIGSSLRQSFTQFENVLEWLLIISVFLISYIWNDRTYIWQNYIAGFAVLIGWTNMLLMIGQLPVFGIYVTMYKTVQLEFAKLFIAYSCAIIGFIFCYCVAFPSSSYFSNPFVGVATLFIMMTGADINTLTNIDNHVHWHTRIVQLAVALMFVTFVTIILMNLLVGIAVGDIQKLKENAELWKLVRQTEIIYDTESALIHLPSWLRNNLLKNICLRERTIEVAPIDPEEKSLPRDLLKLVHIVGDQSYEAGNKDQNSEKLTQEIRELKRLLYKSIKQIQPK